MNQSTPRTKVPSRALLACLAIAAWDPVMPAYAGCAAVAPTLIAGPRQMPSNGALALILSHPLWHSRRAATGPADPSASLGRTVEDLPFVLLRNSSAEPLKLRARRDLTRGLVAVEVAPSAGWLPGARYELRADVGTKMVYPVFAAVAERDQKAPTWGTQAPAATVIRPKASEPEALPKPPEHRCETTGGGKTRKTECWTITYTKYGKEEEHCVTLGSAKGGRTECSLSGQVSGSAPHLSCPSPVQEPHVALRLPEVQDDHGGVITLEISTGAVKTLVPAAREIDLGLAQSCLPANFPPPEAVPYELLVTPIDAAENRGTTLHIVVDPR